MFETFDELLNYRECKDLELNKDYKCKINDNIIFLDARLIKGCGVKLKIRCDWNFYYQLVNVMNNHKFVNAIDFGFSIHDNINNMSISYMMFNIHFYDNLCIDTSMSAKHYNAELDRFFNNLPKETKELTVFASIFENNNYLTNLPLGLKEIRVKGKLDTVLERSHVPFGCTIIRW